MGFVRDLTGKTAAKEARRASEIQATAGRDAKGELIESKETAQGFFEPFSEFAQRGADASSFLANPEEQFSFLQNNPLFQLALDNANQRTEARAASGGRLSAGDTLQDLSNNVLLSASPLIDRQRQDVNSLLNFGSGIASNQANIETGFGTQQSGLTTDIGAALAGGRIAAANARTAGAQGIVKLASDGAGAFFGAGGLG